MSAMEADRTAMQAGEDLKKAFDELRDALLLLFVGKKKPENTEEPEQAPLAAPQKNKQQRVFKKAPAPSAQQPVVQPAKGVPAVSRQAAARTAPTMNARTPISSKFSSAALGVKAKSPVTAARPQPKQSSAMKLGG